MFGRTDFLGDIPCVHIIQNILKWSNVVISLNRVEVVAYRDVADTFCLKEDLRIIAGHNVVAAKTGQVFRNDHVHSALLHILQKLLKSGPCEVHAGISVIHIDLVDWVVIAFAIVE